MPAVRDEPIRVLVVGLSPLVHAMVEAAFEHDREIQVADAEDLTRLGSAVRETRADVVLVPLRGSVLPAEVRRFLDCRAHVRVLGLEESDGQANLYELVPETKELGGLSPIDLARVVRAAASGAGGPS